MTNIGILLRIPNNQPLHSLRAVRSLGLGAPMSGEQTGNYLDRDPEVSGGRQLVHTSINMQDGDKSVIRTRRGTAQDILGSEMEGEPCQFM
jgi:hypothetical protein